MLLSLHGQQVISRLPAFFIRKPLWKRFFGEENLYKLKEFKEKFSKNYNSAKNHFETAIDEIDKTISHLNKIKNSLLSSINQLRLANDKTDELTIKRLTKDNPTMIEAFSTIECIEE